MQLRPYQTELMQKVRKAWREGKKAPCLVLPCGGGKSVIVAEMAKKTTQNKKRVLFLVHRVELCDQIERTFTEWGVDMSLCSVMMVQTATRRLDKMPYPALIITDENHHCMAETYRRIYEAFPKAYRIGVTATPIRTDGKGLGDVNDCLIVGVSAKWLIENGYLSPYRYIEASIQMDLSKIKVIGGDFSQKDIEHFMMNTKVFGEIVQTYQERADGIKAICYCPTVKYSKEIASRFRESGISAVHLDGETPKDERNDIISKFRKGEIQILCNVELISEGFDVPDCGCVIMLRPTKSLTLYIQQAMRCMRYQEGKTAVIIDHVLNRQRHGYPDDDRQWTLKDKPKRNGSAPPEGEGNGKIIRCPRCSEKFILQRLPMQCPKCGEWVGENINVTMTETKRFAFNTKPLAECRNMTDLFKYAKFAGYKAGWAIYEGRRRGYIK